MAVARLFDQKYGGHGMEDTARQISYEGQAHYFATRLRSALYPTLSQWEAAIHRIQDAKIAAQPVKH
jgi:hypothetical protein